MKYVPHHQDLTPFPTISHDALLQYIMERQQPRMVSMWRWRWKKRSKRKGV